MEAAITVRTLRSVDEGRWDHFVSSNPKGSWFQLCGWKRAIERTFGYTSCYAYSEHRGRITGVLPLFRVSNWVMGKCLLSVPFGVYGGICAEDPDSDRALLEHAKHIAESEKVQFLEFRNRDGGLYPGFHGNSLYATFTTDLPSDPEVILKRLPRDTRYMIRKAEKAGLCGRVGLDQLNEFYPIFAQNMRRHGTPLLPLSLFDHLIAEFGNRVHLLMIYHGAKPVSGVLSFTFGDTIFPYYAGASDDATRLAANNYMYWFLMKEAVTAGLRRFDFGRSKRGTGSYAFKTQWNMRVEPLDYQVYLVRRKTVPNFSPLNPKFETAAWVWRRLPAWLAKQVGPRVVRWFP